MKNLFAELQAKEREQQARHNRILAQIICVHTLHDSGFSLRQIATVLDLSHEQIRRILLSQPS